MKDDEKQFLLTIYEESKNLVPVNIFGITMTYQPKNRPRDIINRPDFPIHHKRAWYLLEKWTDKGWYEFGVTLDLGWLTEKGEAVAEAVGGSLMEGEIRQHFADLVDKAG